MGTDLPQSKEEPVIGLNKKHSLKWAALASTGLMVLTLATGCNSKGNDHPDVKDSVKTALKNDNLGDVDVSQDRDKGVLTLTGNVDSQDKKSQAETVAQQNAPGYTVADEIGVRPPGAESQAKAVASNTDDAIESNYKAEIKGHKNLDDQSISANAKNGVLTLKGSVKTRQQKAEAEKLAKSLPNVQQVVDEIEVKHGKHSTAAATSTD
jgi:hyperosmotically inducible periplasmic protein